MVGTSSISTSGLAALWASKAASARSSERLATGLRINRGADDPAGLIASEKLGARQAELSSTIRSLERETSYLSARDGALGAVGSMVSELSARVVEGANTGAMGQSEFDAVRSGVSQTAAAIDSVVGASRFNGSRMLDGFDTGSLGRTQIGTDPDTGDAVYASVRDIDRLMSENPEAAQAVARQAVEDVAVARAEAGARQREAEAEQRAAQTEFINTASARSQIRDTDYASEVSERTRTGIMEEASIRAMLIGRQSHARAMDLLFKGAGVDVTA